MVADEFAIKVCQTCGVADAEIAKLRAQLADANERARALQVKLGTVENEMRALRKDRREHSCRADLLDRTPDGTELAYLHNGQVIVTGDPPADDDGTEHNCDAMGCSSVSHVIKRLRVENADRDREHAARVAAEKERDQLWTLKAGTATGGFLDKNLDKAEFRRVFLEEYLSEARAIEREATERAEKAEVARVKAEGELSELRGRVAAAERNAAQTASALVCVGHDYMRQSHLDGCETCRHLNRALALAPAPAVSKGGGRMIQTIEELHSFCATVSLPSRFGFGEVMAFENGEEAGIIIDLRVPEKDVPGETTEISNSFRFTLPVERSHIERMIHVKALDLICHEVSEWMLFDGVAVFDPHGENAPIPYERMWKRISTAPARESGGGDGK